MTDLTVVMPVYNEADCIEFVVRSWLGVLNRLGMTFNLLLINDGSKDLTEQRLNTLVGDPRIRVLHQVNEGHGPTILKGYRLACSASKWVFQVDSDDEMSAESFTAIWAKREVADCVFGKRQGRKQTPGRKILSVGSRLLIRLVCGTAVPDVNVPFRLMRSECLSPLLDILPSDMFAPNVALAGLVQRRGLRIEIVPVLNRERQTGVTSLVIWQLFSVGVRSMVQVMSVLLRDRIRQ
jgi:glycosyltransferase involved in cell wall biosynthesis